MNESCDTCVSRFLCPTKGKPCMGWNHEGTFWGLVKLNFPLMCDEIDRKREVIKSLQDTLKPCPVCGSKVRIENIRDRLYAITCTSCDSSISYCMVADSESEVIKAWNRR